MKRLTLVACLLALSLLAVATAQAQESTARLRLIHASPNAQDVDILIDGQAVFTNVPFNKVTDYTAVAAGSANVAVVATGETEPILAELPIELTADQDSTLVIAGKPPVIEPYLLEDNNSLPTAGQVKLRFIHLSPNLPEVDVVVQNGALLFSGIPFKNSGRYITIEAETYNLEVQIAGTGVTALEALEIPLADEAVYTIFATGSAGGIPELQALVSVDAGEGAAPIPAPTEATPSVMDDAADQETQETDTSETTQQEEAQQTPEAEETPQAETEQMAAEAEPTPMEPAEEDEAEAAPMEPAQEEAEATPVAPAEEAEAEDDGVEPATMPATGGEDRSLLQFVLLGMGAILVALVLFAGLFSSRRRLDNS